jgi:hypothetical protein
MPKEIMPQNPCIGMVNFEQSVRQQAVSRRFRALRHFTGSRSSNDIAAYASELCRIVWKLGGRRKPREKRNDFDS